MSDRIDPPRLLVRLEAEIAAATSQLEADCKRAERAAYLARLARLEEAQIVVEELQARNGLNPNVTLSVWTNFANGLLTYYGNIGVSTDDRVQRAHALSVAAGLRPLQAMCAAWLAQWDYSRLDMNALAGHVHEALALANADHHTARSRACLVTAQALHLAGRIDLATRWYERSRFHAAADGDDVTMSALMHNKTWLHMLTMRQAVLLAGREEIEAAKQALANAASTDGFDEIKGDRSWSELKPILRAQIVSLQGNPSQAVRLYEQHLASAGAPARLQANLFADKAWCHMQLLESDRATACAELALTNLSDETQVDDRAATHSRLAQVFSSLGDAVRHKNHLELAHEAWDEHLRLQASALELLAPMGEQGREPTRTDGRC